MKARRVVLTIEVESNESIKELRDNIKYAMNYNVVGDERFDNKPVKTKVLQIQSNVIQKKK
jgi:hypothetical protein